MRRLARYGGPFAALAVIFSGASCGDDAAGTGASTPNPTTTASSTASTGGAGGAGGAGGEGGSYVCEPNEGVMLAISELRFGAEQVGGWKKVGMNIDGLNSTANSTDVCQPNSGGSPAYAHPDGDDGIDNSFGKNLLPM